MCDKDTEQDIQQYIEKNAALTRRDFNKFLTTAVVASGFAQFSFAEEALMTKEVMIQTPDGIADCFYTAPTHGKHPAVVLWTDIKGRRPAFDLMGKRLASAGYSVLVVNPFYRDVKGAALPEGITFPAPEARAILGPMREKLTQDNTVSDNRAFFHFLDQQAGSDTSKPGAVLGYCMSGAFAMWAAAALPERVGAIATFHGGGLATAKSDSPHLTVRQTKALALHAVAENDNERSPDMVPLLIEAYQQADLYADIKVYEGTLHGWTPPDSRVYNEKQADKAWHAMLGVFKRAGVI